MVAVPAAIPVTMPDVPIVATPVLLLSHVPPTVVEERVVVVPAHKAVVPVITAGIVLMVIDVVVLHPATV